MVKVTIERQDDKVIAVEHEVIAVLGVTEKENGYEVHRALTGSADTKMLRTMFEEFTELIAKCVEGAEQRGN